MRFRSRRARPHARIHPFARPQLARGATAVRRKEKSIALTPAIRFYICAVYQPVQYIETTWERWSARFIHEVSRLFAAWNNIANYCVCVHDIRSNKTNGHAELPHQHDC